MAKKTIHLIDENAFEVIFGITKRKVRALGIEPTLIDGVACFPLDEVVKRCNKTVARTMAGRVDSGQEMTKDAMKVEKLKEQTIRLKLESDQTEAGLVNKEEYDEDFADKMAVIKSILSEIPEALLEACPDIDPDALDIVRAEVELLVGHAT